MALFGRCGSSGWKLGTIGISAGDSPLIISRWGWRPQSTQRVVSDRNLIRECIWIGSCLTQALQEEADVAFWTHVDRDLHRSADVRKFSLGFKNASCCTQADNSKQCHDVGAYLNNMCGSCNTKCAFGTFCCSGVSWTLSRSSKDPRGCLQQLLTFKHSSDSTYKRRHVQDSHLREHDRDRQWHHHIPNGNHWWAAPNPNMLLPLPQLSSSSSFQIWKAQSQRKAAFTFPLKWWSFVLILLPLYLHWFQVQS